MIALVDLPGLSVALVNVVVKPAGKLIPLTVNAPPPAEELEIVMTACAEEPTRTLPKFKLPLTEMVFAPPALALCVGMAKHAIARKAVTREERPRSSLRILLEFILF